MLFKLIILYFTPLILTPKVKSSPEKMVEIAESQLNDLNAKRDELIKLKQEQDSWKNETTHLRDENEGLKNKLKNFRDDYEPMKKKVWVLMWFRWLTMIKSEIEWRETAVTDFTFNRKAFEEEHAKNKAWTKEEEHRRQLWNQILENRTENGHIVSLVHEIDKTGVKNDEFCRNIATGYKEISSKLLSMMRWRNLPKLDKEPNFNTPITWSPQVDRCLQTLMFDIDKYMVWEFKVELAAEEPELPVESEA